MVIDFWLYDERYSHLWIVGQAIRAAATPPEIQSHLFIVINRLLEGIAGRPVGTTIDGPISLAAIATSCHDDR